jgi:hypothetical protein
MKPEEQRAEDAEWLEALARRQERLSVIREGLPYGASEEYAKDGARLRRILAALTTEQEPVAWRIQGEDRSEDWVGDFDYITDAAGVAEESAAEGHTVTPLCPCATAPQDQPATDVPPP